MNHQSHSKADMHVHSKYSDRPSEWFLRRIGAPESFVEPVALYHHCRRHGMDFVTISDHNRIDGALEIADLPGSFLSAELTTYFPEDGCKIHILVSGITEAQFAELNYLRENIYDLRTFMLNNDILHSVNHPFFSINGRLTVAHIERLLVMFTHFEAINGTRNPVAHHVAQAIFTSLSEDRLSMMAEHYGIVPRGSEPWKKVLIGGSDDHSGYYAADAWTSTPVAKNVDEFIQYIRNGHAQPGGDCGSCTKFANSLIMIASQYISNRLAGGSSGGSDSGVFGAVMNRLTGKIIVPQKKKRNFMFIRRFVEPLIQRHRTRSWSLQEKEIVADLQDVFSTFKSTDSPSGNENVHERNFMMTAKAAHELSYRFFLRFLRKMKTGSIIGAVESLAALSPVLLGIAPYLTSYKTQHRDDRLIRSIVDHFHLNDRVTVTTGRRAWLTDTFDDINGVSHTIRTLASLAHTRNGNLSVITALERISAVDFPVINFQPVGSFSLPEYPQQELSFPPILNIIDTIERNRYDELIVSTPGPVGLCGLLAARLLNIPVRGIYHTDFPRYIREWTEDDTMSEIAGRYMRWFYGQMNTVYAPTEAYVEELIELGIPAEKLRVLPRGVCTKTFNPSFRQETYWQRFGLNGGFKYVYVGRVAYEKNVKTLLEAWKILVRGGITAELAVVGDGPHRKEIMKEYEDVPGLVFTGFLKGNDLSCAYAASDILVFPSMTDTFGNVVLEAHASGLPAIVSDRGGPQEIVRVHRSGLIVDASNPQNLAQAMIRVLNDQGLYTSLKQNALQSAALRQWDHVLDLLDTPFESV
ncbi:glycosyltransferase [bacterium]|nr:glycosyltransferase [candidate division CSSED10-310 bacterium]